jgi:hypothetical protein
MRFNIMDKLKSMAEALAASTAPWLDKPTTPPISWAQTGDVISVVLADGRKVSATVQDVNALLFKPVGAQVIRPKLPPAAAPGKVIPAKSKAAMPKKQKKA